MCSPETLRMPPLRLMEREGSNAENPRAQRPTKRPLRLGRGLCPTTRLSIKRVGRIMGAEWGRAQTASRPYGQRLGCRLNHSALIILSSYLSSRFVTNAGPGRDRASANSTSKIHSLDSQPSTALCIHIYIISGRRSVFNREMVPPPNSPPVKIRAVQTGPAPGGPEVTQRHRAGQGAP